MKTDIMEILKEYQEDPSLLNADHWNILLKWEKNLIVNSAQRILSIHHRESISIVDTPYCLEGRNIQNHLQSCFRVSLSCATLGEGVDTLIQKWANINPTLSKAAHIAANLHLENCCKEMEEQLSQELFKQGLYVTNRYWPGYGDFPAENQRGILKLLGDCDPIPIYLDENHRLHPQKSVTWVTGISKNPRALSNHDCSVCNLNGQCIYSKYNQKKHSTKNDVLWKDYPPPRKDGNDLC